MSGLKETRLELKSKADPEKAKILQGFFRTGKGEYGEGDIFLGVIVPETRKTAAKFCKKMGLGEIKGLLESKIHEERLCAFLMLVQKFEKGSPEEKKSIFEFYISNAKCANNWDLVDLSAPKIAGKFLLENGACGANQKGKEILYAFARSENLWERRIAIISTFAFIRNKKFGDALKISEILIGDRHDLIHKAAGWMLREIGKRDIETEEGFLEKHCREMPRTMLRYAIERFPEKKRKKYLAAGK